MGRIKINNDAVEALCARPEIGQAMADMLQPALKAARESAPVVTGDYRDNLAVEVVEVDGVQVGRLVAHSDHGIFVEAEHGILSRALDSAGGPS